MEYERKELLTDAERAAQTTLKRIANSRDWQLFCIPKFSDVIEIRGSGISDDDFDFASRAHIDFVLADAESVPQLAIEVDACQLREHHSDRARKKDRLAHHFGLALLRIDVQRLSLEEAAKQVEAVTLGWLRVEHNSGHKCHCGKALCFDPQCVDLQQFEEAIRDQRYITTRTKLVREVESTEYSTAITYSLRSASTNHPHWTDMTYVTVTKNGGISHADLAVCCSGAKARSIIDAQRA